METQEKEQAGEIKTEQLGGAITKLDIDNQTEGGLNLFRERARVAKEQLKIALTLVSPGQIIVMEQTDKETGELKQQVYFTGGASDRILRLGFGMSWGQKDVRVYRDEKEVEWAEAMADLITNTSRVYETFVGRRKMGGFVKNEDALKKGAIENMKHQAVTDILGLRFLTPADLLELGLDVKKLPRRVEFQDHGEDATGEPTVEWGKQAGKKLSEISDRDLAYLEDAAKKALADPEKKKWHAKEQRRLSGYEAERKRRAEASAAPKPAAQTSAPASSNAGPVTPMAKINQLLDVAGITDKAERAALFKSAIGKTKQSELDEGDVARMQQAIADRNGPPAEPGSGG